MASIPDIKFFGLLKARFKGVFSSKVEESLHLRMLGLGTFWLVALAVGWVGGNPAFWLGAGLTTTMGHAFSWRRRYQRSGIWPYVMAMIIVILSIIMRNDVLAAVRGNWVPVANFLLMVQAVSSFDIRTRGGLYAGFGLSGLVLFFASQQAFDISFGLFLVGFTGLFLTFLARSTVEDESAASKSPPNTGRMSMVKFWSVTAACVLGLSIAAFLLIPQGNGNSVAFQEVAALPITGTEQGDQGGSEDETGTPQSLDQLSAGNGFTRLPQGGDSGSGGSASSSGCFGDGDGTSQVDGFTPGATEGGAGNDVVMHVRSPVASYWRGQVYDRFDGEDWSPGEGSRSFDSPGRAIRDPIRYTQTFYINQDIDGGVPMGYRAVRINQSDGTPFRGSPTEGSSYQVLSAQPNLVPEELRADRVAPGDRRHHTLPNSLDWLPGLADQITAGTTSDFDKAASIAQYLRDNTNYNAASADQLQSSASMEEFLLEGKPGTSLDYASANVLLARAAGLPARLATGYLPGERDVLSGAYVVREDDAHAWAEIAFREHGPVPFDATPRADEYGNAAAGSQVPGLAHLFDSSIGDDLLKAALAAPSQLAGGVRDSFGGPVTAALMVIAAAGFSTALAWIGLRYTAGRRKPQQLRWSYIQLPGEGRQEMLKLFIRVEKLLKKQGVAPRGPELTLEEYATMAREQVGKVAIDLTWLTRAAWAAAYDPRWDRSADSGRLLEEARIRYSNLKAALA